MTDIENELFLYDCVSCQISHNVVIPESKDKKETRKRELDIYGRVINFEGIDKVKVLVVLATDKEDKSRVGFSYPILVDRKVIKKIITRSVPKVETTVLQAAAKVNVTLNGQKQESLPLTIVKASSAALEEGFEYNTNKRPSWSTGNWCSKFKDGWVYNSLFKGVFWERKPECKAINGI